MTPAPRPPDPPSPDGREVLVPATRAEWRDWLESHPERSGGVWVVYPKKSSGLDGPDYDDLVQEALCFGWIDSVARRTDDDRRMQWFSPRRRGGLWSRLNKERIEEMIARGLMTERGQTVIDAAKADGSWSQADDAEAMALHSDVETALAAAPQANTAFQGLPNSMKKQYLWWVYSAKRDNTRANRIAELIRRLSSSE